MQARPITEHAIHVEVSRRLEIEHVAGAYKEDAFRARRAADWLYVAMFLLIATAVVTAVASFYFGDTTRSMDIAGVGQRLLVPLLSLLGAVPFWIQAERHRRSASEFRRLELQFRAFEPYLEPFSGNAQAVMRAALAPRLFSRVLEDLDPMREPIWPDSAAITTANSPDGDAAGPDSAV